MGEDTCTVAVDIMGSDGGASVIVDGIARALDRFQHEIGSLVIVGDEKIANDLIKGRPQLRDYAIDIVGSTQVIEMNEKPASALRTKKDSSMYRAIDLLKNKHVDGVMSCGNTGCLVAGGVLKLRMLPGVHRPALACIIPNFGKYFVLLDVGANPSTSAKSYIHNAILGSMYYNVAIDGTRKPRVGLLSIGVEDGKGSEVVCEVHEMLKKIKSDINYCGLIEGFQLFEDCVDVVVCDGFVGNILLKTMEGLARTIKGYIKNQFKKNLLRMLGAMLSVGVFRSIRRDLTPDRYCGAPLLGLNGTVVKSHGSSSAEAVAHALLLTFRMAKLNKNNAFGMEIEKFNSLIV